MTVKFDPDEKAWLETAIRSLISYVETHIDTAIYEIIDSFPPDRYFDQSQPLQKTLIHFENDDITNPVLGFGKNAVDQIYDNPSIGQIQEIEALHHVLNFDVGIWASERTGGSTARRRAYQELNYLFNGAEAYNLFFEETDMQLRSFNGGNSIVETINDVEVWRMAAMTLVIECYSRRYKIPEDQITNVAQNPGIRIDDVVIVDQ